MVEHHSFVGIKQEIFSTVNLRSAGSRRTDVSCCQKNVH